MKKFALLAIILIAMLATNGCSLYGNNQTSAPRAAPATTQPATAIDNDSGAINIENFTFSPNIITIKKSAVITWTNNDSTPHQIKSETFNSGALSKGQSFSFTFSEAEEFNYTCSIQPAMTGQIIVE